VSADLPPLAADEAMVILDGEVLADPVPVAALLAPRPDVAVQVNLGRDATDLDRLALLPPLRRLSVLFADAVQDVAGLVRHADSLTALQLELGERSVSLAPLAHLGRLRQLYLRKPGWLPDAGSVLAALRRLEHLTLHSVTLADTGCLAGLPHLRGLALKLGGTKDLSILPTLPTLEFVELWRVRALDSIEALGGCAGLTTLFLQTLAQVRHLPDLSGTRLAHLYLEHLPALADLTPLRGAPLQQLWLIDMGHLRPSNLEPLVGHPTLRAAVFGLGSATRNEQAEHLFQLPEPDGTALARYAAGVMALPPLPATDETADCTGR
jgi:hypothetical protein